MKQEKAKCECLLFLLSTQIKWIEASSGIGSDMKKQHPFSNLVFFFDLSTLSLSLDLEDQTQQKGKNSFSLDATIKETEIQTEKIQMESHLRFTLNGSVCHVNRMTAFHTRNTRNARLVMGDTNYEAK